MGLPFWDMPDRLVIEGCAYPINTDFRVGIRLRQMFWDPYYTAHPSQLIDGIVYLLFSGMVPHRSWECALIGPVLWYLLDGRVSLTKIMRRLGDRAGEPAASRFAAAASESTEPVFSYLWDTPALYAAFRAEYGLDLLTEHMHLWQFDALFSALSADCALCRTMAIRASVIDDTADPAFRASLAAQKAAVRIPGTEELHALQEQRLQQEQHLMPGSTADGS